MSTINPLSSRGPSIPFLEKPLEKPSKKLLFIPIFGWIAYAFLNARYNSSLKNRTVTVVSSHQSQAIILPKKVAQRRLSPPRLPPRAPVKALPKAASNPSNDNEIALATAIEKAIEHFEALKDELLQKGSISQTDASNHQREIQAYQEQLTSENGPEFTALKGILDEVAQLINEIALATAIEKAIEHFEALKAELRQRDSISQTDASDGIEYIQAWQERLTSENGPELTALKRILNELAQLINQKSR